MGILKKINKFRKSKKEEETQKRINAFMEEYKALSKKHGLDIAPSLHISEKGIIPIVKLVNVEQTEQKK